MRPAEKPPTLRTRQRAPAPWAASAAAASPWAGNVVQGPRGARDYSASTEVLATRLFRPAFGETGLALRLPQCPLGFVEDIGHGRREHDGPAIAIRVLGDQGAGATPCPDLENLA